MLKCDFNKKLLCNFIEIILRRNCFPVNLLDSFGTTFPRNTSGGLLLKRLPRMLGLILGRVISY